MSRPPRDKPARGRDRSRLDDEELVAAWQDGDADAFDELIDRFTPRVFGICHRYFGDATDAEEATQETFVTLVRRGSTFRGQAKFSTWLYRVTTNVCHDLGRKRSRRPSTVPLDPDPEGPGGEGRPDGARLRDEQAVDVDDALLAAELGAELTGALRRLDVDQRTAIVLHDVYGFTYEEIATRTGVAVGTAKSRVHRGHARLADELDHLREEPAGEPSPRDAPEPSEPSGPDRHLTGGRPERPPDLDP